MASIRRDIRSHHSIRGMAALLVFVLHLQEVLAWGSIELYPATSLIAKGYLWVDCFFILSGFVLCYVYAASFNALDGRSLAHAGMAFLRARFARIYPLHLFALASILLLRTRLACFRPNGVGVFSGHNTPSNLLLSVFLLQSWEVQNSLSWNNPSWSISAEALAYLLFPLLCVASFRIPKTFVFALVLTPAIGYAVLLGVNKNLDCTFHLGLLRCISGFTLGMLVFRLWQAMSPLARRRLSIFQLAVMVLIPLAMHLGANDGVIVLMLAILVLTTADDQGPAATILQHRALIWLGAHSYAIYMIHFPVIYLAAELEWYIFGRWVAHGAISPTLLAIVLSLVIFGVVLALAALTYRFVEIPMRARLSGRR